MTPFSEAKPGDMSFVYVVPPEMRDDVGWVTDPEWFEDLDDPATVTRQVWQLLGERTVIFHPSHELCPVCHGEGEIEHADTMTNSDCLFCDGDGRHPLAGQEEVKSTKGDPRRRNMWT